MAMSEQPPANRSVLIPTGRQMKSYACMRSLNRSTIQTVVASEYDRIPHFSSRYCSEQVRLSSSPDDLIAYRNALLELAARPDVETIIPVRECDAFLFAKYHDAFDEHVSIVTPQLETLRKAQDRLRLAEEAAAAGVPVPETRLFSDSDGRHFDAVVKSRYNILTSEYIGSYAPEENGEKRSIWFREASERLDTGAIQTEMDHEPIVQEYIPHSDRVLYCALYDDGEPLATSQHRQIRGDSWVGGGAVYRTSTFEPAVEGVASELLSHLEWHGLACVEYLKDERTGEWKFIEINPRLWQSLPSAVSADADYPYYYWLTALGETERIDPTYDEGVACHSLHGEFSHLLSIRRDDSPFVERPSFTGTVWEIAKSCLRHPRFDNLWADDPGVFVHGVRDALSASRGDGSGRQFRC